MRGLPAARLFEADQALVAEPCVSEDAVAEPEVVAEPDVVEEPAVDDFDVDDEPSWLEVLDSVPVGEEELHAAAMRPAETVRRRSQVRFESLRVIPGAYERHVGMSMCCHRPIAARQMRQNAPP